ncbi:hypothetical protein HZC34_05845 [Candidatus Saganbacteria bacterium]|nr:hypothetical protein [Candidatus Saganbacteria bacterium]
MIQIESLFPFLEKTSVQLLNVFYGLAALIIGFVLAKFFEKIAILTLQALKFDDLLKTVKFNSILEKGEVKKKPSELVGTFIYWIVIYLLIVAVAFMSGLPVESAIEKIFSSLSLILIAAIVLSLGSFFAILFGSLVYVVTVNFGLPGAKTIARLIQYVTVIMAFLLALEQLGIGAALLVPSIGVIIGALGLAVAIAFGLGCKDIMADFVSNLIKGK